MSRLREVLVEQLAVDLDRRRVDQDCTANQHDVAPVRQEAACVKRADQALVDGRAVETKALRSLITGSLVAVMR